ncbi:unnamed protein product, partial [Rotaria sp. Silwood1]
MEVEKPIEEIQPESMEEKKVDRTSTEETELAEVEKPELVTTEEQ